MKFAVLGSIQTPMPMTPIANAQLLPFLCLLAGLSCTTSLPQAEETKAPGNESSTGSGGTAGGGVDPLPEVGGSGGDGGELASTGVGEGGTGGDVEGVGGQGGGVGGDPGSTSTGAGGDPGTGGDPGGSGATTSASSSSSSASTSASSSGSGAGGSDTDPDLNAWPYVWDFEDPAHWVETCAWTPGGGQPLMADCDHNKTSGYKGCEFNDSEWNGCGMCPSEPSCSAGYHCSNAGLTVYDIYGKHTLWSMWCAPD